ncbi:PAS domain-containing protein [Leptolyngbya sp. KIOST-1]|uniref:PAS domain-containing protein n=1 Tax=Leptolyngbya sp. KIOST-1 TaxID=1229172 RepID=UPI00068E760C|nr:PAS domain-containing protein [Leptolyngbya sp. KIOST-1]
MTQISSQSQMRTSLETHERSPLEPQDRAPLPVLLLVRGGDRDRLAQALPSDRLLQAETLPEALALWHRHSPAWAVVDPDWAGGGLAFLAALGQTQPQRPLPVLLLVGPGQERTALEAMKLGAADYLFSDDLAAANLRQRLDQSPPPSAVGQVRQQYQNLVENSPDIVERFDRQLRHLYVSPTLTRLTGIESEAFLGKTCRELGLDSTMVDTWEAAAATLLASGTKQTIEFTIPTPDRVRHFEMVLAPERSVTGEIESILCISRDISDRVAAERTLAQLLGEAEQAKAEASASRDRLARVFERINDGIVALDRDGCFTYINHRAAQTLGRDPAALLGRQLWEMFPEVVGEPFYYAFQRAIAQQQPVYQDQFYAPFDRWFENRIYPDSEGVTVYFTDVSDRKAAAASRQQTEDLRQELTLLEQMLDSVLGGYWDIDLVANTAYWSPGFKAMFGYTDDELPNQMDTWQALIFPEDLTAGQASFDRHIQSRGEIPHKVELRYRHKNGSLVWVLCTGQVIAWDEAGQPLRVIGCHVDITQLKQAEVQLRKNEAHLQTAQRIGNLGSWEFEVATQAIAWSEQVYRIFGLTPGEQPPSLEALQGYFHPADRARHGQVIEAAITTHQPYDEEFRIVRADGSSGQIHVKGEAMIDELGQLTHLTGTVQDISERRHHERERDHLSLRLGLALDSGGVGIWTWDMDQTLTWDQRMYEIYGLPDLGQAVTYSDWASYVHPDDLATVEAQIPTALTGETKFDVEFRCCHPDGQLHWVRSTATVRRSPTGQPIEMVGIHYDITEHKQTAIELERLSLRLTLALASGRIGSWERVLSTDEVIWDQCLIDLYGFERLGHQATYQDWRAQVYAEDIDWVEAANQALIDSNAPYDVEFRVWRGDGSLGWIRSSALVQRDAHGQPVSIIGINYDITDQKQTAARLQTLSTRLTVALESGGFGSWEWDLLTDGLDWDQRLIDLYGFGQLGRPATYQDWRSRVHPEDVEAVEAALQAAIDTDAPYEVEFRIYRCNGELRWVKSSALVHRNSASQPLSLIGINYDITQTKQAETQLRDLSLRLSMALKSGEIGTWAMDLDTQLVDWDQRMCAMYGCVRAEQALTLADWRNMVFSEDVDWIDIAFAQILDGLPPETIEFRIHRGDGEMRWIRATALVQHDDLGRPRRLIGTNTDITEAKLAEQHLRRTTAQLEASNLELEAFAYSVSHDLRAPLRAIDGFSRALLEDYGDQFDPEGKDYFDRIRHNVARMGCLIDDLLRLSRVSRQTMAYGTVNLSDLVQAEIDDLRSAEPDRVVTTTVTSGIAICADPTLMRVAIANLVQNAWKFTGHRPEARLEFGVAIQAGEPVYYLRDNGAGFDMAYADKLFGVFQRLHNTHEFPGTGIGLATVQRAIHRQGGRVWAEAAVDQGATFYFTLPQFAPGAEGAL